MPSRLPVRDDLVDQETLLVRTVPVLRARTAPNEITLVEFPGCTLFVANPTPSRGYPNHLAVLVMVPVCPAARCEENFIDLCFIVRLFRQHVDLSRKCTSGCCIGNWLRVLDIVGNEEHFRHLDRVLLGTPELTWLQLSLKGLLE